MHFKDSVDRKRNNSILHLSTGSQTKKWEKSGYQNDPSGTEGAQALTE